MFTYLRNLFVLLAVVLFSACELFESPNGDKEAYVRVTPSSELIFPSSASSCSITIESSGKWTITGANDWVTVSPDRGDDGTDVIVSVAANELSEERSAELMVLCDGAEATITIMQEQKMETDYVDMAFDDAGTTIHYDAESGDMTVTYSNESNMPDVVEGSAIVLPAEYQFDIRVVESVSTSGNTISLSTSQGNMCNLFRNTSFTLSTTGDTRATGVDGHPVIAPVAVGYLDESGKYVEVYNEDNSATRIDYSIPTELWSFDLDYSGNTLWNGGGGRLWWDKCSFDAGLKGLFNFSFGEKSGGGILGKVGNLESFSYTLQGNVDVDMLMRYRYENSATFSDDRILKYNVIPTGVYTFLVNGVRVHLLVYTHLGQYVELGVEGSVEVSGGVNLGMNVEAGMSWTKDGGFETIKSAAPYMNIYHPTIKAEASAYAKLSYYPQIEIGLYKFIGPWFEPRSYIKEVVSAGFRASTDGENYVAFKDEYFSGLDMRMGLKLDFGMFDKEVAKTDVFNVVDDTLLTTSPARITLVSPSSGMKLEDDESVDVKFKVEAYSPVTGKYWATDNAAVVFSTESGELSDYVVLSDASGMVKVNWNPTATRAATKKHTLRATLYDIDGTVIDGATFEATFGVKTESDDHNILVKFYEDTGGDNWVYNSNWCSDLPLSEWYGVKTNYEGRVVSLSLSDNNLTRGGSLSGLDALSYLSCEYNQLTSLDVSGCAALRTLDCYNNQLTSLDVSGCAALDWLRCDINQLTSLDVSGYTALNTLWCYNNQLTSLDVSGCAALERLDCINNQLTSLDVSGCAALYELRCYNNQLTSLDVSGCTALWELRCYNNQLTSLDVSGYTALETLNCASNQLTSLDVSGCTALETLGCASNQLTSLDASGLTALYWLICNNNQLASLDVSGCTALWELRCNNNQLTSLDASGLTGLYWLWCDNNQLTSLDISGCTEIMMLDCSNNKITQEISGIFAEKMSSWNYDVRYEYDNYGYTDNGVGWWYPGEPEKGYHGR